jgi:hypothetical protein
MLDVEKEPPRFITPGYKFIGRLEEAAASEGLRARLSLRTTTALFSVANTRFGRKAAAIATHVRQSWRYLRAASR